MSPASTPGGRGRGRVAVGLDGSGGRKGLGESRRDRSRGIESEKGKGRARGARRSGSGFRGFASVAAPGGREFQRPEPSLQNNEPVTLSNSNSRSSGCLKNEPVTLFDFRSGLWIALSGLWVAFSASVPKALPSVPLTGHDHGRGNPTRFRARYRPVLIHPPPPLPNRAAAARDRQRLLLSALNQAAQFSPSRGSVRLESALEMYS